MARRPEGVTMTRPQEPMLPTPYRVQRRRRETADTFTLELAPVQEAGLSFAAGQFNMVYVFGVGEVPISISGNPLQAPRLIHTIRAVGTVTSAIRALPAGAMVGIRGPFGSAWPVSEAAGKDVVLVAGGIGLAPLRPVLYELLAQRQEYGKIVLLYGTRTPQDLLYRRDLERWRGRFDLDVQVTVDRAMGSWYGNVGVVTRLLQRATFAPLDTLAMICGPEVMMRFTIMELLKRGLAEEHVYVSMERNMQCAIGFCGHCQFGPTFVCKDGPVLRYDHIKRWFGQREI
jgi:NAD(P)H-flavin reductase